MQVSTSTLLIATLPHYGDVTDLAPCFRAVAEAGFSAVDLSLQLYCRGNAPLMGDGYAEWAARTREKADHYGITIAQAHGDTLSGMEWDDPTSPHYADFEACNLRCIEAAKILGVKWMVLHPSNLPHAPEYSAKDAKEVNLAYLAPLINHAKKHGVGLAVENMVDGRARQRYGGRDPYELLELVDTINDPSVGICVDTGHAHTAGLSAGELIRLAGKRLKATHIHDNHGSADSHLMPLYGSIDWQDVTAALREVGYENDFSFELAPVAIPKSATVPWLHFIHSLGESLLER